MNPSPELIELPTGGLRDGRVELRWWSEADAAHLHDGWNDPTVARWTAVPADSSLAAAHRWIAGAENRRLSGLAVDLVIWLVDADSEPVGPVGEVGLAPIDWDKRAAQVGYWVNPEARGNGLAHAALALVTSWSIGSLGLRILVARCDPDNPGSAAVAASCGYRNERSDPSGRELLVYRASV